MIPVGTSVLIGRIAIRVVSKTTDEYFDDPDKPSKPGDGWAWQKTREVLGFYHGLRANERGRYLVMPLDEHTGKGWPGVGVPYEDAPPTKMIVRAVAAEPARVGWWNGRGATEPGYPPLEPDGPLHVRIRRVPWLDPIGTVIGHTVRQEGDRTPGSGSGDYYEQGYLSVTRTVPLHEVAICHTGQPAVIVTAREEDLTT